MTMVWGLSAALILGITQQIWAVPAFLLGLPFARVLMPCYRARFVCFLLLCLVCFSYGYGVLAVLSGKRARVEAGMRSHPPQPVHLHGWVSGFPRQSGGQTSFPFDTTLFDTDVRVLVQTTVFGLSYGDSLSLVATFSPTKRDSWRRYLFSREMVASFRARPERVRRHRGRAGNALTRCVLAPAHEFVRRRVTGALGDRGAIPVALLIGERGGLSKETRAAIRKLGITHLFALSGMHLGLIVLLLLGASRATGIRSRLALVLALSAYVGIVGEVPSLRRAYTMATVLTLSAAAQRGLRPLDALGQSLFAMLLYAPPILYAVGFQLSFVATFAVLSCVRFAPARAGRRITVRIGTFVRSTLVVGIGVQLFLLPVLLRYFGTVSLIAPVATVVFLPLIVVILVLGLLAVGAAAVLPPAGELGWRLLSVVAAFAQEALNRAGAVGREFALPEPNMWLYYAGLGMVFAGVVWRRRLLPVGGLLLAASFFIHGGGLRQYF